MCIIPDILRWLLLARFSRVWIDGYRAVTTVVTVATTTTVLIFMRTFTFRDATRRRRRHFRSTREQFRPLRRRARIIVALIVTGAQRSCPKAPSRLPRARRIIGRHRADLFQRIAGILDQVAYGERRDEETPDFPTAVKREEGRPRRRGRAKYRSRGTIDHDLIIERGRGIHVGPATG